MIAYVRRSSGSGVTSGTLTGFQAVSATLYDGPFTATEGAGISLTISGADTLFTVGGVAAAAGIFDSTLTFVNAGSATTGLAIRWLVSSDFSDTGGHFVAPLHEVWSRRDLQVALATGAVTSWYNEAEAGLRLPLWTDVDLHLLFSETDVVYPAAVDASTRLRFSLYPHNRFHAPPLFEAYTDTPSPTDLVALSGDTNFDELNTYPLPFRLDGRTLRALFAALNGAGAGASLLVSGLIEFVSDAKAYRARPFPVTLAH